ncbi:MAG: hypothetical protein IRY85_16940 [Micromonosporaceae bacterium]|nr:hypothetical protein [Micromonosporaceae bacterium]
MPVTATPVPSAPPPAYYPPPAYPVAPGYPVAGYPAPGYPAAGYYGYPGYPVVDPATGLPYSDKSKVTAGLLQLLLGLLAIGGVGRLYAGNTALGATQLALAVVGWLFLCGPFAAVAFFVLFGLWIWFWVDGIVMLAGRPVDGYGRPLR